MKFARLLTIAACLIAFAVLCPLQSAQARPLGFLGARASVARAQARGDARVARAQAAGGVIVHGRAFPQRAVIVNQGFGARVLVLP